MGFVDHQQAVRRQVVKQGWRRLARPAPGEEARVVFNAGAVAQLVHHFEVKLRTLAQALLFQQFVIRQQHLAAVRQLHFDLFHRLHNTLARRHVVRFRVDGKALNGRINVAGQRVKQRKAFHLFVKQLNTQRQIVRFGREDVDNLATHAESRALERLIVAGVLQFSQTAQNGALVDNHAHRQVQHHFEVQVRVAQTVDSGHRGHHHHVTAFEQRFGGRQTHLLNVFVHRSIFFDEGIRAWDVRFRLVVVVVGDEVLHRVFREERFHFAIQLGRQRFVRRQHHRRTLQVSNHVGNGKGFPRPRYA